MRSLAAAVLVASLIAPLAPPAALADPPAAARRGTVIDSYALFSDVKRTTTMDIRDTSEIDHIRKLRRGNERLLWFRVDGKAYVVRDAATIDAFEAAWKPVSDVGKEMGALGGKLGALGAQQGALGTQQATLGLRHASIESKLDDAALKDRAKLERELRDLDARLKSLDARMDGLEQQMAVHEREMRTLERKIEAADVQARADSGAVAARAIASGAAILSPR